MEKEKLILVIVLAVMILIAGVQAYQFSSLKSSLSGSGGSLKVSSGGSGAVSSGSSGGAGLPSSLQNIPSQVGGC